MWLMSMQLSLPDSSLRRNHINSRSSSPLSLSSIYHNLPFSFVAQNILFTARRYAERGYATVCCPSLCPSVRLSVCLSVCPTVCDAQVPWSHSCNTSKIISIKIPAQNDPNIGDLVQREHPQIRVEWVGCRKPAIDLSLQESWAICAIYRLWVPWKFSRVPEGAEPATPPFGRRTDVRRDWRRWSVAQKEGLSQASSTLATTVTVSLVSVLGDYSRRNIIGKRPLI